MTEAGIANRFRQLFSGYEDFNIEQEVHVENGHKNFIVLDLVISYGKKHLACIEVKTKVKFSEKEVIKQLNSIQKCVSTIKFYFCLVDDAYLYYNVEENRLEKKSDKEVFELLRDAVSLNAIPCDELLPSFKSIVHRGNNWKEFEAILYKHLETGKLLAHGNNIFLDRKDEMNLMFDLLTRRVSSKELELICRYTSAKSFFLSLENGFRINSVEAMNDELETKVIDGYPNLKTIRMELAEYVYNGYVMSFSLLNRKDQLFNWYMYGDRAKGVCLIVKKKEEMNLSNDIFIAPVVYVPHKSREITLLDFLNELMSVNIGDKYNFKLRYWHFWKYFFKYNFYEDEKEVRILWIDKGSAKTEWSSDYNTPYNFIEKDFREMPFNIEEVILGPKCESKESLAYYLRNKAEGAFKVSYSEIFGYR